MYRLSKIITDLPSDIFIDNNIIYFKKEEYTIALKEPFNEDVIYFSDEPYIVEKVSGGKVTLRNTQGLVLLEGCVKHIQIPIPYEGNKQIKFIDEHLIIFRNHNGIKWDIKAIKNDGKFLWSSNIEDPVNIFRFDNVLIFQFFTNSLLSCHSLSTGEEKWRIDIGSIMDCEHFSIYGDIHEFNGKLYFFVAERHTDNKATLCINIETGALIRKLDNYLGWLHLANDHFYIVSDTAISILNPDTFAIEDIDVSAIMKEYDWIIAWDKFVIKDQYLYFTTMNIGSQTAPSVGVIDMQERKLLWSQAIAVEQSWQNVSELRVEDKRLYVLTHDNTLHIFEEENRGLL